MSKPIVHALWHGRPLCGFMPQVLPGSWPAGHRWIAANMYDLFADDRRACTECVVAFADWKRRAWEGEP